MKRYNKKIFGVYVFIGVAVSIACLWGSRLQIKAQDISERMTGRLYEFDEDSKYEISTGLVSDWVLSNSLNGLCNLEGDIEFVSKSKGFPVYKVNSGNVTIKYDLKSKYEYESENNWIW